MPAEELLWALAAVAPVDMGNGMLSSAGSSSKKPLKLSGSSECMGVDSDRSVCCNCDKINEP